MEKNKVSTIYNMDECPDNVHEHYSACVNDLINMLIQLSTSYKSEVICNALVISLVHILHNSVQDEHIDDIVGDYAMMVVRNSKKFKESKKDEK